MAEKTEGSKAGRDASYGADPAAVALALESASRAEADAFLKKQSALTDDQRALIADQRHHLHEQLKNLRLIIWENRMGVLLRMVTAVVGVAVASLLGAFVWNAARSDGLIVESFSVPPDLAARGLTGEVVANQLHNNLSSMQSQTASSRPASTFTNNWGNDIKVEIPETGVSVGELNRYLREWLGHETHITGAVYHTSGGITVTAQVGDEAHATLAGSEADFDQLLKKTSEVMYRATQPYRYAVYLRSVSRTEEAVAAFQDIIANGDVQEQPWALIGLANLYYFQGDLERAAQLSRRAHAAHSNFYVAFVLSRDSELPLQHDEAVFAASKAGLAVKRNPGLIQTTWDSSRESLKFSLARVQGDYQQQEPATLNRVRPSDPNLNQASALLGRHETGASEILRGNFGSSNDFNVESRRAATELSTYAAQARWSVLLERYAAIESGLAGLSAYSTQFTSRNIWPLVAYAMAMSGDFPGAHALMDRTPADCSLCLRMRGRLAVLEKNWGGANDWFTRAAQFAPSTPFPFQDWGRALLDKGDADAAITKFTMASKNGPHFADPLEGWGEALMATNRSDLALEKFQKANKYAPNWGRLHLKWGEALVYAGNKEEAVKQLAQAASLDLTPSEKSELAGMGP